MLPFSSEGKKDSRNLDLGLISELSKKANRKLTYLGLTSPWMGDIEKWKPLLAQIYAVEREKKYLTHLLDRAYSIGVFEQTRYFWGDIDQILKEGIDYYKKPIGSVFPVDLINLDYCYGLDMKQFQKLSTLELIMSQQKSSLLNNTDNSALHFPYFLILLTHSVPQNEGDPTAKRKYIGNLIKDVKNYAPELRDKILKTRDWYLSESCPPSYLHKCFVMGRLIDFARNNNFQAIVHNVIQYQGDKDATMLHYQFQVSPTGNLNSQVPPNPKLGVKEIFNQPITDESGGDIAMERPLV